MPSVLITGCDVGLGREFAVQYAGEGHDVIATYRDLANRIADDSMRHFRLDVTRADDFAAVKTAIGATPLDLLISNAGIARDDGRLGELDFDFVQQVLAVNTVGPLRLVETFADNVAASRQRRVVLITSRMGSIASNLSGGHLAYRASKAGLNAIGRSLAIDLFKRGITVAMLHPGWVGTAGGGDDAPLTAHDSVASMRAVVARLGNHETGSFCNFAGQALPW